MQLARAAQKQTVARAAPASRKAIVVRGAVKCQAQKSEVAKKAAAAFAALPALVAANPAFALVDDRLNGDGVGYALGVSDPALGWAIGGVASLIWILYFIAQRDFGDFEDNDSGVGL
jgi:photosystem II PsbW protein